MENRTLTRAFLVAAIFLVLLLAADTLSAYVLVLVLAALNAAVFSRRERFPKYLPYAMLTLSAVLIMSMESLLSTFTLLGLVLLNAAVAVAKRYVPTLKLRRYTFGIEIILFSTILTSISFGPVFGALMGIVFMATNYIAERRFSRYLLVTHTLYAIIGYAAYSFRHMDLFVLGTAAAVLYNLISFPIVIMLGANKRTMLVFSIVNVVFNIFLFASYGQLVRTLLSL